MINRRALLIKLSLAFFGYNFFNRVYSKKINYKNKEKIIQKTLVKSNAKIPSIGMGTWLTFDVGYNTQKILQRTKVLNAFFQNGGQLIDSSPMYGTSETVLGKCLKNIKNNYKLFSATKVWTPNTWHGIKQIENSIKLWNIKNIDLLQVHNLVNYEKHLETLFNLKSNGKIKYVGITTSHGWRHEKTLLIMRNYDLDFVQFTYNIVDREAEKYLLDLAYEKNISVIVNRPFQGGNLFNIVKNKTLPSWAENLGIKSWPSFFLKYVISHKAVTCAIPATTKVEHMKQNMEAMYGYYPDNKIRIRMENFIKNI